MNEALTHCAECGLPFSTPETEARALEDFDKLEDAAYICADCENGVTDEFSLLDARAVAHPGEETP